MRHRWSIIPTLVDRSLVQRWSLQGRGDGVRTDRSRPAPVGVACGPRGKKSDYDGASVSTGRPASFQALKPPSMWATFS
jgi:hypothetical protein